MMLDLTQPIDEKLLKKQSRYLEYQCSPYFTRAHVIVEAIRKILWDKRYTAEFNEVYDRAKNAAGDEQDRLYAESDLVSDKCFLYAIAIARKNGPIGPNYVFALWRPDDCEERFGIELPPLKSKRALCRIRQHVDVDKLYEKAVQEIRNTAN